MEPVLIKACLNGVRDRQQNPHVPWTPQEVAAEALRCAGAGAAIVHFHARSADGATSYDPAWYGETDALIREGSDLILNHTTIRPAGVPLDAILAYLRETPEPVDMISLVMGTLSGTRRVEGQLVSYTIPNPVEEIRTILAVCDARGIVPEPTLFDLGMLNVAESLLAEGILPSDRYFLLEPTGTWGDGRQLAPGGREEYFQLADALRARHPNALWVAHGSGLDTFRTCALAMATGAHVRVGFEDSPALPTNDSPTSNAEFVEWAVQLARLHGREPMTPRQARTALGLI